MLVIANSGLDPSKRGNRSCRLQSRKTYCAAFCASPVLIFAGSGHNASCNGLQWLEKAADCNRVREDVARLIIYTWAS